MVILLLCELLQNLFLIIFKVWLLEQFFGKTELSDDHHPITDDIFLMVEDPELEDSQMLTADITNTYILTVTLARESANWQSSPMKAPRSGEQSVELISTNHNYVEVCLLPTKSHDYSHHFLDFLLGFLLFI